MRVYTIGFRNRFTAFLALLLVLGVGAGLVLIGLTLLAGLAAAGAVVGAGMFAYRAIRGPRGGDAVHRVADRLDPALEIFPAADSSGAGSASIGAGTREAFAIRK